MMTKQTRNLYNSIKAYTCMLSSCTTTGPVRILATTEYASPVPGVSISFVTVGPPKHDSSLGCPLNEATTCIRRMPNTFSCVLSFMLPIFPYGSPT